MRTYQKGIYVVMAGLLSISMLAGCTKGKAEEQNQAEADAEIQEETAAVVRTDDPEEQPEQFAYSFFMDEQPMPFSAGTSFVTVGKESFHNVVVFVQFEDGNFVGEDGMAEKIHNLWTNAGLKSSLAGYINEISYGQFQVDCIFPQYDEASGTYTSYVMEEASSDEELIRKVIDRIQLDSSVNLDYNNDGCVDNLTIVTNVATATQCGSMYHPHFAYYGGAGQINGSFVRGYNILNMSIFNDTIPGNGTVCHEFLHSIGYPDLYSYNDNTLYPVGEWDIMAMTSCFLQYPLAYYRSKISGWFDIDTINETRQGVTLNVQTDAAGTHAYIIKSPLSATEFFVVEYREKSNLYFDPVDALDKRIPGSGLIIYRVNTSYRGNATGQNGVYVFRTGVASETDDAYQTLQNSFFSKESGRTSFGSDDPSATIADGALTFSNGMNSGIVIRNIGSAQNGSITFDVVFPESERETVPSTEIEKPGEETDPASSQGTSGTTVPKETAGTETTAPTKAGTESGTTAPTTTTVGSGTTVPTKADTGTETTAPTAPTAGTGTTVPETPPEQTSGTKDFYAGYWTVIGNTALGSGMSAAKMTGNGDGKDILLYNDHIKLKAVVASYAGSDWTVKELSTVVRDLRETAVYGGETYLLYHDSSWNLLLGKISGDAVTKVATVCTAAETNNNCAMIGTEQGIFIVYHRIVNGKDVISAARYDGKYSVIADSFASGKEAMTGIEAIAYDGTALYVAYVDASNWDYAVKVYKGTVSGGFTQISCAAAGGSVAMAAEDGKMFLAVAGTEYQGNCGVAVYEYNSTAKRMNQMGGMLTRNNVACLDIAVRSGAVYTAYSDQDASQTVVKAYDAGGWQQIGNAVAAKSQEISLVVHNSRIDISYLLNNTVVASCLKK